MESQGHKTAEQAYDLIQKATRITMENYDEVVLFTWHWWLGIGLTFIPWILWFLFRDKSLRRNVLIAAFFMMFISSWLDYIGVSLGLWIYKYELLPISPSYLPWDYSVLPVVVMFFLQYKPDQFVFRKALGFAILAAFFGEPLFRWLDVYEVKQWRNLYSFPIYIILFLLCNYFAFRYGKRES